MNFGKIPLEVVQEHLEDLQSHLSSSECCILYHLSNMRGFLDTDLCGYDRFVCGVVFSTGKPTVIAPEIDKVHVNSEINETIFYKDGDDAYGMCDELTKKYLVQVDNKIPLRDYQKLSKRAIISHVLPYFCRMLKTKKEIELLKAAKERNWQMFAEFGKYLIPGMTEIYLRNDMDKRFKFLPLVQSGPSGGYAHNFPGERKIEEGDSVIVDNVIFNDGYCSDITRTYFVRNKISEKAQAVYDAVSAARKAAINTVRPGITAREVDKSARDVIIEAGFGDYFNHRLGHGIGMECHELPYIAPNNFTELLSGMTFTIEPGIYIPNEFGVRIEDVVLVTESGCEVL